MNLISKLKEKKFKYYLQNNNINLNSLIKIIVITLLLKK